MIAALSFPSHRAMSESQLTPSIGSPSRTDASDQPNAGFAGALRDLLTSTAQTVRQGEAAAIAGIEGAMPTQTVVEHVMAAERSLQAAIAIRDKMVTSYLEISRMQI